MLVALADTEALERGHGAQIALSERAMLGAESAAAQRPRPRQERRARPRKAIGRAPTAVLEVQNRSVAEPARP